MRIAILPSTQWTSCGSGIGNHNEAELCQDVAKYLKPELEAAGHTVAIFAGADNANVEGAQRAVGWRADCCISLHLDASTGTPAGLLCYQAYKDFGLAILKYYCADMGIENRGGQKRTPGTNGVAVLRIPTEAGIPNCLIELGDMNKPDGANWLNKEHRQKAAASLMAAILLTIDGRKPKIQEVDDMYIPLERVSDQDGLRVLVSPEAWYDLDKYRADAFLLLKNEGVKATTAKIYTTPGSGEHKVDMEGRDSKDSRQAFNLASCGIKGGFAVTVKTTADVVAGISIMATKK